MLSKSRLRTDAATFLLSYGAMNSLFFFMGVDIPRKLRNVGDGRRAASTLSREE